VQSSVQLSYESFAFQEVLSPHILMLLTCNLGLCATEPHSAVRPDGQPIKRLVLHRASLDSGIMQRDVSTDESNLNISSSPTIITNLKQRGNYMYRPLQHT
jgi:hypothetical protein